MLKKVNHGLKYILRSFCKLEGQIKLTPECIHAIETRLIPKKKLLRVEVKGGGKKVKLIPRGM